MNPQSLVVANHSKDISHIWRSAVQEGEERAHVTLSPILEDHLVLTLQTNTNRLDLERPIAFDASDALVSSDALALIMLGGKCLIIAGLFPLLARRRNVQIGYFVNIGKSAYKSHAVYWEGRGAYAHAHISHEVVEHFHSLVATLRGIRPAKVITDDLDAIGLPETVWN